MTENKYTSIRLIDGKTKKVIVNETGKVLNRKPSKEELKDIEEEPYTGKKGWSDKTLLDYLREFEKEYRRPPRKIDFVNNHEYPSFKTYERRFGSWSNALKLAELDVESMAKKGVLETRQQKTRLAEINVINHFKQHPIDLAGENQNNSCDGICPNGRTYDVKSSKHRSTYWAFGTHNKYKEEIEIYYFLAFNKDYTKLKYVWRVPGEIVEADTFYVGIHNGFKFNIENMKEYDITEKF